MRNGLALHIALVLGTSLPLVAFAQANTQALHTTAIAPMSLAKALENFSHEAGLQIVYGSEIADSVRSPGAAAGLTPEQQLRQLLAGTGLTYRFVTPNTVTIVPGNVAANAGNPASAAVVTAGSAGSNASTAASSNVDKSTKDLDSVVVTARSGVDVRTRAQTSYSITTIDEDRLRMQAPTSVADAVKSVPGFWVEDSGGEASGNIRARGIPVDGFGSVNLLEDGIPVQHDPALGYLNADQAFRLDETIERVEVVRGGPSSIFYSNAPAGAINFIPRQVDDMPEGLIKYTAGNYGLGRLDFWFGTPLGDGWKFSTGGFFRVDHNIRDPGFNGDNGGQLRATLSKQFENGDLSFDVKRLDDRVYFDLGIPMYRNPDGDLVSVPGFNGNYGTVAGPDTEHVALQQGNGSNYNFDNSLGTDVQRTQLTLKFDYNLWDNWKLAEDLRYSDTDTIRNGVYPNAIETSSAFYASAESRLAQYYPNAAGMQLRYADTGAVFNNANQNGNGLVILGGLRGITMPMTELTSNTRLMRKFEFGDQTHDVTLGYYHAYFNQSFDRYSSTVLLDTSDNAKLLNLVAVNAAGQPIGMLTNNGIYANGYEWAHAHGTSDTDAFYFSDEWQVTDKLRIDGGARWERVETSGWTELPATVNLGTPWSSDILTGSGQYAGYDHAFHKLGWTVGANYQFTDHQGVFARYTSTFRLPNLSTYITTPTALPLMQTMVLPEVGYKFANRYIEMYETFFYTKYNDVSFSNYVFNANTGVSTPETGYADTETYGLELEGTVYPSSVFDVQYDATLQDPRYKGLNYTTVVSGAPVLLDYDDDQLIRVPRKSFRVVPGVNLLNNKLRLQMAYEYEGKRFSDTANSVVLPQYNTISFSARYQLTPDLSVFVYADNITNSLGLTEGNPRSGELKSSDAGATVFIARPLLGRSFRASVMYRF
ncbi:cyclic nucleotide-binding protein [Dyella monticola]|uniref:Cyclic nucleotide-binding protein n=1 Tax=Dyella monticola TaxID=1927958 RepID=A0A370WUK4_9GAMM|nr:TonB-dependent receptor [Dyella monticola]RDS79741.1 cyclic nucleotide-binding protein [Dyella monticola]